VVEAEVKKKGKHERAPVFMERGWEKKKTGKRKKSTPAAAASYFKPGKEKEKRTTGT